MNADLQHARQSIQTWLTEWTIKEFEIAADQLDRSRPFVTYGMNSVQAMILVGDLESQFNLHLPPTLVWDYPTYDSLVEHLVSCIAAAESAPVGSKAKSALSPTSSSAPLPNDPQAILNQLDDLSESELDALLEQYLSTPATAPTHSQPV